MDNRPSNLVAEMVSKAAPDGYTLLVAGDTFMMAPFCRRCRTRPDKRLSTDHVGRQLPNVLVVHPSLAVKSVTELIALAKAHPGALNFGSSASGSSTHLAGALFNSLAKVNIVWVPYKGSAASAHCSLGGEVQMMITSKLGNGARIKSGRVKAFAVASAQPSPLLPGLPTIAATGLPGYEWSAIIALFAPVKTPAAIIKRLNQETVQFLNQQDIKDKFLNVGAEVVASTPEELAGTMKSEIQQSQRGD